MTIKRRKKLIRITIILLILALLSTYIVTRLMANKTTYIPREPYDKTGFVHMSEFDEDHVFEVENGRFKLNLNVSDTKFQLYDDETKQVWKSNPEEVSTMYPKEYHDLFIVYYEMLLETPKSVSVHDKSVLLGHYLFKEIENGIEVLYEIGREEKITFYDLPYQVSSEHYHELIMEPLQALVQSGDLANRHLNVLVNAFMYVPSNNSYLLLENKFNTEDAIQLAYDLIFNRSLYTREHMAEDREKYSYPNQADDPYFEFVVRYLLTDEGFKVQIINDSIYETEQYQVAFIDVLPYFGSNNVNDEGITVIPDGSGILIDHNNGNYIGSIYDKRVYGRDLSIGSDNHIRPDSQETIKMPMYGYTKNNNGFINVLEQSETMASIRAGYRTTISASVYTNVVPFIHYRYYLRERDGFTFQSYATQQRVSIWTKEYNKDDFVANYIFTDDSDEEVSYYELAQTYQNYLVEKHTLNKVKSNDVLHLTMLGGFKKQKHFLGFPYDSKQSLTTPNQINEILDLIDTNGNSLDVSYQGWSNDGIKPTVMDKIKFNKNVTSKQELIDLEEQLRNEGNRLFLEFNTQTAYTDKRISKNKDVSKNILQEAVIYHDFNEAMQIANRNTMEEFQLNVSKQNKVYKMINKINYASNVVLSDEAQLLSSDFSNSNLLFRKDVLDNTINNLKNTNKTVALRNANLYGVLNANKIIDLPVTGGRSRIVDYEIPFLQLVYNGYFNYTIPSANLDTSKSITWHKLKALETGSKMHFTLSYENTVDLMKTQYSNYYSTYYNNWINDINSITKELTNLNIYKATIVSHRTLNVQGSLVEVTYSNGTKFTIDYDTETFVESSVI